MDNNLLNILSGSNEEIDSQKLMDYLNGKLNEAEKHEVEKYLIDNEFARDAMEGLQQVRNKQKLPAYVEQLNKDLHKHIEKRKASREKRKLKEFSWMYFAIILILILCIVAFVVMKKFYPGLR
jgi:hypothetical protein